MATATSLSLLLVGGGMFGEFTRRNLNRYNLSHLFVSFSSNDFFSPPTLRHRFSFFKTSNTSGPALSPALARTPDDALGLAAEEIEALEPVIAEDAP